MLTTYRAVLLDIEGTTTPITFVYDVLFPYARARLGEWLRARWGSDEVEALRALFAQDAAALAACPIPEGEGALEGLIAHALWQMDQDRKSTALKELQGRVWAAGYASGELKGEVFDDVPLALRAWAAASVPVAIYSSGSVQAQQLLFGHTHHGDLRVFLSGYFDTRTGPKREPESYRAIARALGLAPGELLFATDILQEAQAARAASLQAVLMERPGNPPQPPHDLPRLPTFAPLLPV